MPLRYLTAALAVLLFGVADGLLAGNGGGLHAGIANLSAPWLLVALLPALRAPSLARGALTGLVCTLLALGGFYATKTVLLTGQNGGGGFQAEFGVETGANRIYFLAGLVTGPLFGAAGAWLGKRSRRAAWLACGALLTLEIAVVAAVRGHQLLAGPLYFSWAVPDWRPYVCQMLAGVVVIAVALTRPRQPARLGRAAVDRAGCSYGRSTRSGMLKSLISAAWISRTM